jgi:hypothetical protein
MLNTREKNKYHKNRKAVLVASKVFGLDVNTEKLSICLYRRQTARKIDCLLNANKCLQKEEKLKSLEMTITNENCIHEEIKSKLNSGNVTTFQFRITCLSVSSLGH